MGKTKNKLKADVVVKNYWRNNEQFADFFNAVLYEGKQVIKPDELEDMDTEESYVSENKKYVESVLASRDNIKIRKKSTKHDVELCILGMESQEHIHYAMPMRVMGYDYGSYKKQYDSNAVKYKTAKGLSDDEFISKMKRTDKFIPIITIVIYYGEKAWDGAVSLQGMLDIPEDMKAFINDYKMNLVEARKNNLKLHNINNKDLFNLFGILLNRNGNLNEIKENLNSAKRYWGETTGYTSEVEHQKLRLESIGLFEKLDFNPGECPLCSGKLTQPLPSVEMIKKSITALDKSIESVTREQPKLRTFISKLENDEQQKQEEIKRLKTEIDSLYQQEDEKEKLRDLNVRRGKVIGRISLWLESVQNDATSEAQEQHIKKIEERLNEIDGALNRDSVEERKQSALSRIQQYMTKWEEELELEHSDSPYRLDLNKMTVVVDKSDRPVPLKQLGSGSNWVGVHLITYFALQYYFIESNRPVPRFLFLDQPSQVYFPSELDEQKIDEDEDNKMYKFIIDRTEELHGQLQVIVVDHTAGEEDQSHQFVTESWWKDDKKLIPDDWYEPNEALIPVS